MIDLTEPFQVAVKQKAKWSEAKVLTVANLLVQTAAGSEIAWDRIAREQWARIIQNDEVIALILLPAPLILLRDDYVAGARSKLLFPGAVVVFNGYHQQKYRVEKCIIEQIFNLKVDDNAAVDFDCLSIGDLWSETVAKSAASVRKGR